MEVLEKMSDAVIRGKAPDVKALMAEAGYADGFTIKAGANGPGMWVGGTGSDNTADRAYFMGNANNWMLLTGTIDGATGGCYYKGLGVTAPTTMR